MPADPAYTIADLARLTGVNVRTIRYYLAQGLLPASGESGPGAHYGDGHLNRLRLTKRLQEQHLPLAEIRRRLAELTDAQAAELLATSVVDERAARQTSALEYVRNLLGQGAAGQSVGEAQAAFMPPTPSTPPSTPPGPGAPPVASVRAPASMSRGAKSMPIAAYLLPGRRGLVPEAVETRRTPDAPEPGQLGQLGQPGAPEQAGEADLTSLARAGMPRMRDVPAGPATTDIPIEPQSHERSQWERLSLGPNVEIHIRRPLSRIEQRRVERLLTIARQVLKEEQP